MKVDVEADDSDEEAGEEMIEVVGDAIGDVNAEDGYPR